MLCATTSDAPRRAANGPAVREKIERTADDRGELGKDEYFGYGRINARRALAE